MVSYKKWYPLLASRHQERKHAAVTGPPTPRRSFLLITGLALGIAVALVLSLIQTERTFVAQCSVTVVDKQGHPISGIRVSEEWHAYSYDLDGGDDIITTEGGKVDFPARSFKRPLMYWYVRPILTKVNYGAHASFGVGAYVNVSDPRVNGDYGFSCTDRNCRERPINLTFQVNSR